MVAPFAVMVNELPEQMEPLLTLKVGVVVASTVLVATDVQEPLAPRTEKTVVVFGFATTTLPVDELKSVVGLHE